MRTRSGILVIALFALSNIAYADSSRFSAMVPIAGGSYVPFFSDQDRRAVQVAPFEIDSYPVSRRRFLEFVRSHEEWRKSQVKSVFSEKGYLADWSSDLNPGADAPLSAPVTQVSWFAASAFCETEGKNLPTTDQWEYVLFDRGRGPSEAKIRSLAWFSASARAKLPSVGAIATNGLGVHGMYDSIWEWTNDFDSASPDLGSGFNCGAAASNSIDPSDYAAFMRYSYRNSLRANFTARSLGFRCVRN